MYVKRGRPTNDPKNSHVVVRLNETSSKILTDYCKQCGVTRSEAVRMAIPMLTTNNVEE